MDLLPASLTICDATHPSFAGGSIRRLGFTFQPDACHADVRISLTSLRISFGVFVSHCGVPAAPFATFETLPTAPTEFTKPVKFICGSP
ncbi:hypothetical protein FEP63_06137 [Burkholderia multivorans]|nr:hypothetical protein [Burkholderia multivorans]